VLIIKGFFGLMKSTYHRENEDIAIKGKPPDAVSREGDDNDRQNKLDVSDGNEPFREKGNMLFPRWPFGRILGCVHGLGLSTILSDLTT